MAFESLLNHFYATTGIEFRENRHIVESKIRSFLKKRGYRDFTDFYAALKEDSTLHQELINHLTTSETYFYREFSQIELFLHQIKGLHKRIKILCAPCASGEEPYSLLIAMLEHQIALKDIEIYGIDINTDEIDKAKRGIYPRRRLHQLPGPLQEKYFRPLGDERFEVLPVLQQHIHFRQMNLFDPFPSEFSDFDVIFSRNMLIYFDSKAQQRAEKIFHGKLRSGGMLFLGHADHIDNLCGFEKCMERGIGFFRK